jgi:hypothetical protein
MNVESALARLFGLDGDRWLRHANPKSVYSRFPVLWLIALSVWSRVWLGRAFLVPLALTLAWTFFNPHLFDRPDSLDTWASKGVLGERVWQNRDDYDIPRADALRVHALNAVQVVGMVPFLWGLYVLDPWMTVAGLSVAFLSKVWFFDRMVWLYEDYADHPEVRAWLD